MKRIFLALSGASGAVYGIRTLDALLARGAAVSCVLTDDAIGIVREELGVPFERDNPCWDELLTSSQDGLNYLDSLSYWQPVASGSNPQDGYVIAPCSMGMAGRIAAGTSGNLVERAADVALKERRPLVLVPREAPWSAIHLENLLRLTHAGATVCPAAPHFYQRPASIDELVDTIVQRILQQLGFAPATGWQPPA